VVTSCDKAIAAVIAPLIIFGLLKLGFNADPTFSAELTAAITGLLVYIVPNKVATGVSRVQGAQRLDE
jgi:hypothetical protein